MKRFCVTCWRRGCASIGLALAAWLSCVGDVGAAVIVVQPIQVRQDDGTGGATVGFFESATDKIYAQVGTGIDVHFLSTVTYDETDFLVLDNNAEVISLFTGPGHSQHANAKFINMWFVNTILPATTYGIALIGGNGVAIAGATFTFNLGNGRIDTIAHEIGHNLGLPHTPLNPANNLMTDGNFRTVPATTADITPDGLNLDQLTAAQDTIILASPFVQPDDVLVPEPGTMTLAFLGGGVLVVWRRRRVPISS